jgi:predicted RNA binding protein YcfA (HicA-like mRNA interferase family)
LPLRPLPYRIVRRKLLAAGFQEHSQRGSHVKFLRITDGQVRTAIVPQHHEIALGTLRAIARQAGLTIEEFDNL